MLWIQPLKWIYWVVLRKIWSTLFCVKTPFSFVFYSKCRFGTRPSFSISLMGRKISKVAKILRSKMVCVKLFLKMLWIQPLKWRYWVVLRKIWSTLFRLKTQFYFVFYSKCRFGTRPSFLQFSYEKTKSEKCVKRY